MSIGMMARALKEIQTQFGKSARLAALGDVASCIAQNLRRPLAGVKDAAPVGLAETDTDTEAQTFADIIAGTDRFECWLHRFLSYLRPLHLHRTPCDLNQLFRDALSALGHKIDAKALRPVQQLSPLPSVAVDPLWMEQAFLVILTDAIEVSTPGGRLIFSSSADSHGVTMTIVDEGKGRLRAVHAGVFEAGLATDAEGVGLGLIMAKKIVEAHNGTVALHSEEGKPTTVTIRIPLCPAPPCR